MRKSIIIAGATLAACLGGTAVRAAEPRPMLIPTVVITSNDSPLVRAAKIAVASRKTGTKTVIDNVTVGHTNGGVIAFASGGAAPIPETYSTSGSSRESYAAPKAASAPAAPSHADEERAALAQRHQALKLEEQRMRDESDDPYGNEVEADRVEQRLTQIPNEQKDVQEQQNAYPTPPPPPPPQ
jgi:hypothetical protein